MAEESTVKYLRGAEVVALNNNLGDGSLNSKYLIKIKEDLNKFFNLRNVNFLLGSGTSAGAIPTMKEMLDKVSEKISKNASLKNEFDEVCSGSQEMRSNLESILGVLYSHRAYLDVVNKEGANVKKNCYDLINNIEKTIFNEINIDIKSIDSVLNSREFQNLSDNIAFDSNPMFVLKRSINELKKKASNLEGSQKQSFDARIKKIESFYNIANVFKTYEGFYKKIVLRNRDLPRINIFTTNNDLFNETVLDSLSINYINGFGGGLRRFFNPAFFNYNFTKQVDSNNPKYEPVENLIYLYKIHGSVNWLEDSKNLNSYFNITEKTDGISWSKNRNTLVYPTPTKQNKSLGSPYVDLFREFQKKLLEANNVLFIIGYSFSDEHVNNIIYQALATNPSINIVILNELGDDCKIINIRDNRIYQIYGTALPQDFHDKSNHEEAGYTASKEPKKEEEIKIHYFENIVKYLIPDLNTYQKEDETLKHFIKQLKESTKDENR